MTNWQLKETYYGDPDSLKSSEMLGWKPYHVEIGIFVSPDGDKKREVLDNKADARKEKRKHRRNNSNKKQDNDYYCSRNNGHPCEAA